MHAGIAREAKPGEDAIARRILEHEALAEVVLEGSLRAFDALVGHGAIEAHLICIDQPHKARVTLREEVSEELMFVLEAGREIEVTAHKR
tara:strand:- start:229 stop:498 length:270 start_codon:yes stop_codon:yes gene_type:complete